jgi:hypothetical protein
VSHNEHPFPCVWGAQGARGKHRPFRIEPERGQISENATKPPNKEVCAVFHEHETGSKDANGSDELGPQPGLPAPDARLRPGPRNVLAREPAADEVTFPFGSIPGRKGADIVVPPNVGPVLRQYAPAEWVYLHLPDAAHPGPFKP